MKFGQMTEKSPYDEFFEPALPTPVQRDRIKKLLLEKCSG